MAKEKKVSPYRAIHHLRRGGLHRALGVSEEDKIPAEKLAAGRDSKNEHVSQMSNYASMMSDAE